MKIDVQHHIAPQVYVDKKDLESFRERANEPVISYERLLQELQADGKL